MFNTAFGSSVASCVELGAAAGAEARELGIIVASGFEPPHDAAKTAINAQHAVTTLAPSRHLAFIVHP